MSQTGKLTLRQLQVGDRVRVNYTAGTSPQLIFGEVTSVHPGGFFGFPLTIMPTLIRRYAAQPKVLLQIDPSSMERIGVSTNIVTITQSNHESIYRQE